MRRGLRRLDRAIMPMRCVFCGSRSGCPGEQVCRGCRNDMPWITIACSRCAAPLEVALPTGVYCADCQARPPPFTATVAPLRYEFPVDAGIKALKFGRRLQYGSAFGALLSRHMQRLPATVEALLPVPLHRRRQALRGFNQARELCRPLARRFELPIIDIVRRRRSTSYQSGLSASERRKNLRDAFVLKGSPKHRHIVIVDDVVTTGETTRQVATVLLEGGVREVSVLAVARAV
jgi:ComF family protein